MDYLYHVWAFISFMKNQLFTTAHENHLAAVCDIHSARVESHLYMPQS